PRQKNVPVGAPVQPVRPLLEEQLASRRRKAAPLLRRPQRRVFPAATDVVTCRVLGSVFVAPQAGTASLPLVPRYLPAADDLSGRREDIIGAKMAPERDNLLNRRLKISTSLSAEDY